VDVGANIWYFARLGMLLIVVVIALILAIVLPRRRKFAGRVRGFAAPVLAAIVAVLSWLSAARPSWLWLAGAFVIGMLLGFFMGRMAKPSVRGNKPAVRRWVLATLLVAFGLIAVSIMVLFGTPYLAALAMIYLVFAWAMQAGSELGEHTVAPKAAQPLPPAAPVAVPVGGPVAPAAPPVYATPEPVAAPPAEFPPPPVFAPAVPAPEQAPTPEPVPVGDFPPPPVSPLAEPPAQPPQE
jgi:hypothetical protein